MSKIAPTKSPIESGVDLELAQGTCLYGDADSKRIRCRSRWNVTKEEELHGTTRSAAKLQPGLLTAKLSQEEVLSDD
jgi:hypothetical protein